MIFSICLKDTCRIGILTEPVTQDEPTKVAKFLRDGGQVGSEFAERERARWTSIHPPHLCV